MEKTIERKKRLRTKFAKSEIPKILIYEELDGKPVYYKGYKDVLNGLKTIEEVRGSSDTQAIIVGCLNKYLNLTIDGELYYTMAAETGLHLKKKTNLSSDIVIYDKKILQAHTPTGKYFEIPPLVILEVDIEAETADLGLTQVDYYSIKTQKLLDFGAEEVFWFFTSIKKVVFAKKGHDWIFSDWTKEQTLLNQYNFSLSDLLEKEGWDFHKVS